MDHKPELILEEDAECWRTACRLPPSAEIQATVVIPAFNAEDTLLRAVHSALTQSMRDIEVLIIDDASSDQTWERILDLALRDERVRGVRHKANSGKPIAMNRAISLARGHWLAVLDADDWYHTERLSTLIAEGERLGADMVSDNQFLYDASAARVVGTAWPEAQSVWPLDLDDYLRGSSAFESFSLGMLKPVIRLDFMRRVGLGYEVQARHGQDFFHLLQFYLTGGKGAVSDRPLYFYTQPFGKISRQWSHSARKRYNFQNAYEINDRYLREAQKTLPPGQWKRLHTRNRDLKLLENYHRTRESIGRRDWLDAMGLVASHPAMLGYLLRRAYERTRSTPGYYKNIHRIARRSARRAAREEANA
jgi:succinoglycan biosynthesis protein ExoO